MTIAIIWLELHIFSNIVLINSYQFVRDDENYASNEENPYNGISYFSDFDKIGDFYPNENENSVSNVGYSPGEPEENPDNFRTFGSLSEDGYRQTAAVKKSPTEPSGMMDTYKTFKSQAERILVPGDEKRAEKLTASPSKSDAKRLSWHTATLIISLCVLAAVMGVVLSIVYWPRKSDVGHNDEATDSSYVSSSLQKEHSGDRSLAHSAQMYHYQKQKQQMLAVDKEVGRTHAAGSEPESEGESDEPDVNVYECPGLSAIVELNVKNPLFQDDIQPAGTMVDQGSEK